MADRAAVFIDGGYLNKVVDDYNRPRVDFAHFVKGITSGLSLLRSYYYQCPAYRSDPPTEEENERYRRQERFFSALRRIPDFEVRLGYLAHRGFDAESRPIFEQKGADIWLAVDMIRLSLTNKIEYVCLVGGDGDFCPVVQAVKDAGVSVRLFHGPGPRSRYSAQLWDLCDQRTIITPDMLGRGEMQSPPRGNRSWDNGQAEGGGQGY